MNISLSGNWEQHVRCPKCDFPNMNIAYETCEPITEIEFTLNSKSEVEVAVKGKDIECLMCGAKLQDICFIGETELKYIIYRGLMGKSIFVKEGE